MPSHIQKIRNQKHTEQGGCCFYCKRPMWSVSPDDFIKEHAMPTRLARLFQCTAEHLVAASEGGENSASNIVAACKYCNSTRHKTKRPLAPELYKRQVRRRLKQGRWLQIPRSSRIPKNKRRPQRRGPAHRSQVLLQTHGISLRRKAG